MAMDMELCITGPEPGKIDHTLYCHVMNLEDPLHLQVQAEFKVSDKNENSSRTKDIFRIFPC